MDQAFVVRTSHIKWHICTSKCLTSDKPQRFCSSAGPASLTTWVTRISSLCFCPLFPLWGICWKLVVLVIYHEGWCSGHIYCVVPRLQFSLSHHLYLSLKKQMNSCRIMFSHGFSFRGTLFLIKEPFSQCLWKDFCSLPGTSINPFFSFDSQAKGRMEHLNHGAGDNAPAWLYPPGPIRLCGWKMHHQNASLFPAPPLACSPSCLYANQTPKDVNIPSISLHLPLSPDCRSALFPFACLPNEMPTAAAL